MRIWWILAAAAVVLLEALPPAVAADGPKTQPAAGVPKEHLAQLRRGLNLSMWWAQLPPDEKRFRTFVTAEDAKRIADMGFTFVRLPVDPVALADPNDAGRLNAARMNLFDASLDLFTKRGVAVIVCPYLGDEPKHTLFTDHKVRARFLAFWRTLAGHLAKRPTNRIFLQVMNEPNISVQQVWDILQERLVDAIRRAAPKHTIIAAANLRSGGRWDPVGGFCAGAPVEDRNVIYDLHFYDPVQFTHQGANWMMREVHALQSLPYPSDPQKLRPHLAKTLDARSRAFAALYGQERWNRQRIEKQILRAAAWGREHKVPILCGEFGCFGKFAPAADRVRYLADVRHVLEKHGIGWAMWDYFGSFGVVVEEDGKRVIDEKTLEALIPRETRD